MFFQAEDGIRDVERSRGLGDVYKRQDLQLVRPKAYKSQKNIKIKPITKLVLF